MDIYNQDKTQILNEEDCDLTIGRIVDDVLVIHHPKEIEVPEEGHYETIAEYPNGGKDVKWVVDNPGGKGHDAYDETKNILVYIPYTAEELQEIANRKRIKEIKEILNQLSEDFVQAQLGAIFEDLEDRKTQFKELHNELRGLLGKEPRIYE